MEIPNSPEIGHLFKLIKMNPKIYHPNKHMQVKI